MHLLHLGRQLPVIKGFVMEIEKFPFSLHSGGFNLLLAHLVQVEEFIHSEHFTLHSLQLIYPGTS